MKCGYSQCAHFNDSRRVETLGRKVTAITVVNVRGIICGGGGLSEQPNEVITRIPK